MLKDEQPRRRRFGVRGGLRTPCALAATAVLAALGVTAPAANAAVSGAAYTTTDDPAHCLNGSGTTVNCNLYDAEDSVWINGGPARVGAAGLSDGTYFFAVLEPGGQRDPVDGAAGNLSSPEDGFAARSFTVTGGEIAANLGTHRAVPSGTGALMIQLAPFDKTSNPGGVYILALCKYDASTSASALSVRPSDCKYDAFKVQHDGGGEAEPLADLTVVKSAAASFDRRYEWTIDKRVTSARSVKQLGGNATFTYQVDVTPSGPTDANWAVEGEIAVFNPNDVAISSLAVSDHIDDTAAACAIEDRPAGANATFDEIAPYETLRLAYVCTYSDRPAGVDEANVARATWNASVGDRVTPSDSASFSAPFSFDSPTLVDACVDVSDRFDGGQAEPVGMRCAGDPPTTITLDLPARTVAVPAADCKTFDNTATFTTGTTGSTGSDTETVRTCGPARTGALTMGFWQNKNGQAIISGGLATAKVCNSGTWLRGFAPFQDLKGTATCADVAAYVYNVVKAANASGASMNAMLKAQMLATALDVYFSDAALGGNKIGAPGPIGARAIDLTKVCATIGSATCSGSFRDSSTAFGGAGALTVGEMLVYAAAQSSAGGTVWYANVKATQELAKNAFDAINNQVAFPA